MFNRLLTQLSILIIPVGFAAIMCAGPVSMMFSIFNQDFFRITEKAVCPETGTAEIKRVGTSRGGTNYEMYCMDVEGQRGKEDVVGWAIVTLFAVYFVAFYVLAIIVIIPKLNSPSVSNESRPPIKRAGALVDSQVRDLLAHGNKVEAIKIVRQATGMGLAEAKNYVEALESRQIVNIGGESSAPVDAPPEDSLAKLRELKKMLDEGLITQQEYEAKKQRILSEL
jgi:hypothetical protein